MAILLLGVTALVQAESLERAPIYVGFLIGQYLVVRFAAANYGKRFVCTVLAIKSAEK